MTEIKCACCGSVMDVIFSEKKKAFLSARKHDNKAFAARVGDKVYKVASIESHEYRWLHKLVVVGAKL